MRKVVATGVFEVIHPGHVFYLSKARELGDHFTVIVARDVNVAKWKRTPHIPEEQRRQVVAALKPVDEAVLGEIKPSDFYKRILEIRPDVIALGSNQEISEEEIQQKVGELGLDARVVRISGRWDGILGSTRKIIRKIRGE